MHYSWETRAFVVGANAPNVTRHGVRRGIEYLQSLVCGLPDAGVFGTPTPPPWSAFSARRLAAAKADAREDLIMFICQCNAIHRRDVVCGGGAALFSAMVMTLMGGAK